ncbi:hypothetical protein E2C01_023769 [Portunus trituberculatus]|uniref:Secreted protein n=1 Tax=Portunus trituberculatus TaxID=210409 RepID=A0A5B7E924_PORTR|nr:hypothetical protein [Portunus trituberculatus]
MARGVVCRWGSLFLLRGAAIQAPEVEKKGRACKFVPVSGGLQPSFCTPSRRRGYGSACCRIAASPVLLLRPERCNAYRQQKK